MEPFGFRLTADILFEEDEPGCYAFAGEILVWNDPDEDEVVIGSLSLQVFHVHEGDPRVAADALSEEAPAAVAAVWEEGDFRNDLVLESPVGNILHIDTMTLKPQWRGQGIGLRVLDKAIAAFGGGCAVAVIQPAPKNDRADPPRLSDGPRSLEEQTARGTLRRYWGLLGFQPTPGHPDMSYVDLALNRPTWKDALRLRGNGSGPGHEGPGPGPGPGGQSDLAT